MYSVSSVLVWRYIKFEKKRKQQYYTFYFKRLKGAFLTNTLHLQWIMILYACHKRFLGLFDAWYGKMNSFSLM